MLLLLLFVRLGDQNLFLWSFEENILKDHCTFYCLCTSDSKIVVVRYIPSNNRVVVNVSAWPGVERGSREAAGKCQS